MSKSEFILDLLGFVADQDLCGMLYWRTDGQYAPVTFWINTNDLFAWACAEGEEVNESNLPLLKQSVEDCVKIDPILGTLEGCALFAARMNKMRPQGAAYPKCRELWPLFDACGPEREISIGNPYRPGEYK